MFGVYLNPAEVTVAEPMSGIPGFRMSVGPSTVTVLAETEADVVGLLDRIANLFNAEVCYREDPDRVEI